MMSRTTDEGTSSRPRLRRRTAVKSTQDKKGTMVKAGICLLRVNVRKATTARWGPGEIAQARRSILLKWALHVLV